MLAARVDDRELEPLLLQALQIEDKPGAVPEEDLHLVLRLADEDEEVARVGIVAKRAFHDRPETVDAFAHVGQLSRKVDPDARWQAEHQRLPSSSATTRANASSSKPCDTLSM